MQVLGIGLAQELGGAGAPDPAAAKVTVPGVVLDQRGRLLPGEYPDRRPVRKVGRFDAVLVGFYAVSIEGHGGWNW